jgi:hypothetical protein
MPLFLTIDHRDLSQSLWRKNDIRPTSRNTTGNRQEERHE